MPRDASRALLRRKRGSCTVRTMLDLPNCEVLDKRELIGGCARLPLAVDAARLRAEFEALPVEMWGTTGGRVGVHRQAEAVFLRGYAPAEGLRPIEDRPALNFMPYARELIEQLIPAPAMRCLLARLPGGGSIAPHIDQAPYFSKTIRIHVPIISHEQAWMVAGNHVYLMQPGEVWALNNSALHAVWNAHPSKSRTHLICDFTMTSALNELLAHSERELGRSDPAVLNHWSSGARA